MARLVDDLRGFSMLQPPGDCGEMVHAFAFGDRRHCAAIRMTADHDIGHPEHRHGVFDRCRHTSGVGAIRRHDIPRVSDHEQFARFLLRQQFWYYAAIGTRDKQRAWMLRGGQVSEQVRPLRKCFFLKL